MSSKVAISAASLASGKKTGLFNSGEPLSEEARAAKSGNANRNASSRRASTVRLDRERPQLTTAEARALYPPEDCLLDEMVHRLRADGTWKERRMILHPTCILVIDIDEDLVIDSIPTRDIDECSRCPENDDHVHNLRAFQIVMLPPSEDITAPRTVLDCRSDSEASASIWVNKISGQVIQFPFSWKRALTTATILQAEKLGVAPVPYVGRIPAPTWPAKCPVSSTHTAATKPGPA